MAIRMHMTVAGVPLTRSVLGWTAVLNGHRLYVKHYPKGSLPWQVRRLYDEPTKALLAYGRGATLAEAIEQAKAHPELQAK